MLKNMIALILALITVSLCVCYAANAAQPQAIYTSSADDRSVWPEDLSEKVDKTIQVLTVIKKELKRAEALDKKQAAAAKKGQTDPDAEWIERLRVKLSAMIRMWKKTEKIMQEDAPGSPKTGAYTTDAAADEAAKQLNKKIDTVIKAMEVLKEEIEAADEPAGKKK